ncbi:hypothetical protein BDQ17DRAFT_1380349 [Cyathus striatus]|nr:hypothetical protein BDQ17DRAFT_1380349 [Cyathus striatus]
MASGSFANAHHFNMYDTQMNEITIHTQSLQINKPKNELPSPIKDTMPCMTQNFTGQESYLQRLHEYFKKTDFYGKSARKMFLLYGMGGIGKTQICLKFKDEMAEHFSYIFWIDATTEDTLVQALKDIYKMNSGFEESFASLTAAISLHWVSSIKTEWLMIFDNADGSPALVEKYLPPGNKGNIIITSRNPAHKRVVIAKNSMEVIEMTEESAIKLLLKAIVELYYLPLAVDLAGAYISSGKCSIHQFKNLYQKYRSKLMRNEFFTGASKYEKTIYGTWEISYQKIVDISKDEDKEDIVAVAKHAINLINIFAFFHYENISENIFERAAINYSKLKNTNTSTALPMYYPKMDGALFAINEHQEWNELLFRESVGLLLSFSLIKKIRDSETYSLHPLIQAWCRDKLDAESRNKWMLDARAMLTISVSNDDSISDNIYQQSIFLHIVRNLQMEKDINTIEYYNDTFNSMAHILSHFAKYDLESMLRRRILKMDMEIYGTEHLDTVKSMESLAYTYDNQGKWNEAEELQIQALEKHSRILGKEHPNTVISMGHLAHIYYSQRKLKKAEELQVQVLEMHIRILGTEKQNTISSMSRLAITYQSQGKWKEAEKMHLQVLEMRSRTLFAEHPYTIDSMNRLAMLYQSQNKWSEAEKIYLQVLEIHTRILGTEHLNTLRSMSQLADTYQSQGKWRQAENMQLQALETRTRILGAEHSDTLYSMRQLAETYRSQGKWNDAEKMHIEVLEMYTRTLGKEHPDTVISMGYLAYTYYSQKKLKEAEKLQAQVLEIQIRILGTENQNTITSMSRLAITYQSQGKWREAEKMHLHVLEMRTRTLAEEHPYTIDSMSRLITFYQSQKKWGEAEKMLLQVLELKIRILGTEHLDTLRSMSQLADTYQSQGKWGQAENMHLQVLEIRTRILGADHPDTLYSMKKLAYT